MNRVLSLCVLLLLLPACAGNALLDQVSVDPETIAPYAGSPNIAATIRYAVSREATVSIYFVDAQGQPHYFRRDQPRPAGSYDAAFSGAIDDRVLPDGAYDVVIEAKDANGQIAQAKKKLNITNADSAPPQLMNYTVFPDAFTPNQDGIADRVTIRYFLSKPAKVDVYLTDGKTRYEVAEKKTTLAIKDGLSQAGAHEYDYDGGIDLLASPPPNGTYTVVADARDAIGNRTRAEKNLTIKDSGIPRATITNSGVDWSSQPVPGGIA
ncbi:MAG: hypothetical protein HY327_06635, partial [Chloroflexi bacterium]|nr:hypothetical protein [Chloroflexota bacterium]